MSPPIKYFYKGHSKDFVIFVESEQKVKDYLKDSTIPLIDVVAGGLKLYTPEHGRGAEGILDNPSKQEVLLEFGDKKLEEIIQLILKNGSSKHNSNVNKHSWESTNDSNGRFSAT